MSPQTLFVAYEPEHIPLALASGADIAAVDFWVERELKKMGVPYFSCAGLELAGRDEEYLHAARSAAREWYRIPAMSFFEHNGIAIGEAFEPMVDMYLQKFLYYVRKFDALLARHPQARRLVVPHKEGEVSDTVGSLGPFEMRVAADAAQAVAVARGITFESVGSPPGLPERHTFPRQNRAAVLVALYNVLMRMFPAKPLRIFASERWFYIDAMMAKLPDAELVLMERSEARHIPWRSLVRHRIRFIHPLAVTSARPAAAEKLAAFKAAWPQAKKAVAALPLFKTGSVRWWDAVEPAFDYLVERYAERIIADIDVLETIMKAERSNRVVLRASIGGRQPHFFLAARVARRLGIPSVELQHSGMVFDAQSVHSRLEADYLASYGELEREQYAKNGYAPKRIVPVGSPRFESYGADRRHFEAKRAETLRAFGLDPQKPTLVCAVPTEQLGVSYLDFDSYDIAAFFACVREVQQAVPDLQVLFKFRPGTCTRAHREYLEELFGKKMGVAEFENAFEVICACDIASSGNSTMMYESMMAGKPLLLFPWKGFDPHLPIYEGAALYAGSSKEISEAICKLLHDVEFKKMLLEKQEAFLRSHAFTSSSGNRTAALVRRL